MKFFDPYFNNKSHTFNPPLKSRYGYRIWLPKDWKGREQPLILNKVIHALDTNNVRVSKAQLCQKGFHAFADLNSLISKVPDKYRNFNGFLCQVEIYDITGIEYNKFVGSRYKILSAKPFLNRYNIQSKLVQQILCHNIRSKSNHTFSHLDFQDLRSEYHYCTLRPSNKLHRGKLYDK